MEFGEFRKLYEGLRISALSSRGLALQAAIHLNPYTVKQQHYEYLCACGMNFEVLRIYGDDAAIKYASANGHLAIVQILIEDPRVDPSAGDDAAIKNASRKGHLDVVQLLLRDPRVNPSALDNEAIRGALRNGQISVGQLLLQDPRVDLSALNNQALRSSSRTNSREVCNLLLSDPRVVAAYLLDPFYLPPGVQVPLYPTASPNINAEPAGCKS